MTTNVLLVTIDCLRRDRCGIYGHHRDTTPTLDAIGRDGYVFDRAVATGPVTTESFPGILAGRLSAQCVAGRNLYEKRIPAGEPILASHLRDEGWSTAAAISNPRIGEHVGADRGFERFQNLRDPGTDGSDEESGGLLPDLRIGGRLYDLRERMRAFDSVPRRYELPFLGFRTYQYLSGWPSVRGERVVDELLESLEDTSSPFLAWTHLMDVHGPLHPTAVSQGARGGDVGGLVAQFRSQARRVSDIHDARTDARYDGAVGYVDNQLERIVDWLKERDAWDDTALIVTADHGDALHDRGIYGHPQHYTYGELLWVPLVVRIPGHDGCRIDRPFSLGWLHELVAEISDVPAMDAPLGSSRESHLSTDGTREEVLLADSISHRGHTVVSRTGDRKYVRQTGDLAETDEERVQAAGVYYLDRDPVERDPRSEEAPELEGAADELDVDSETLRSPGRPSGVDEETKDRLKQLGYAE